MGRQFSAMTLLTHVCCWSAHLQNNTEAWAPTAAAKFCCLPPHKYQQKSENLPFHLRKPSWVSPHKHCCVCLWSLVGLQPASSVLMGQFKCHCFMVRLAMKLCQHNWLASLAVSRAKPAGIAQVVVSWVPPLSAVQGCLTEKQWELLALPLHLPGMPPQVSWLWVT